MPQPAPLPVLLPIDLQNFLNAMVIVAETEGGFGLDDVERVEEAWELGDSHVMSNGYIVGLHGGERVYLEYTQDNTGDVAMDEIEIVPLEPGMERPDLSGNSGGVFWYQASHITEYLAARRGGPAARH